MANIAHISGILGQGVVYTRRGAFLLRADAKPPEPAGATNLNMWMQGPSDLEEMMAGPYPFTAAHERLRRAQRNSQRRILRKARKAGII